LQLGKHKEALEFSIAAQCSAPGNTEVAVLMEDIRKNLATGLYIAISSAFVVSP
jgi:WD and tetratricopeptide repeat-containing protein 1